MKSAEQLSRLRDAWRQQAKCALNNPQSTPSLRALAARLLSPKMPHPENRSTA